MEEKTMMKRSPPVKVRYDRGPHWRAQIGFILIANDGIIEEEMIRLAMPGVGIHFTRLPGVVDCTVETLMAMKKGLADAASRFVSEDGFNVVCFACTSASALIGEERVMAELSRGAPNARTTTLITGVIRALRTLQVRRIVVATPYLDEINTLEEKYLQEQEFDILDIQGMNILNGDEMYRVTPDFILEYAMALDRPEAEWSAERAKIETEGWGAQLLALQDEDGQWAGAAHFPADFDWPGPEVFQGPGQPWLGEGQPWTSTSHVLTLLREFGIDPRYPEN